MCDEPSVRANHKLIVRLRKLTTRRFDHLPNGTAAFNGMISSVNTLTSFVCCAVEMSGGANCSAARVKRGAGAGQRAMEEKEKVISFFMAVPYHWFKTSAF